MPKKTSLTTSQKESIIFIYVLFKNIYKKEYGYDRLLIVLITFLGYICFFTYCFGDEICEQFINNLND